MIAALLLSLAISVLVVRSESTNGQQIAVCPAVFGPLHYIYNEVASTDAADLCESEGLRLAQLSNSSIIENAANLLFTCQGPSGGRAWIGGYNGLAADPCMITYFNSSWIGAYANLGIQFCQTERFGVICEDVPVLTATILETTGTTISYGTSTVFTTTTVHRQHHHHHHHWCPCSSSSSSSCECYCDCKWHCGKNDKNCKICPPAAKGIIPEDGKKDEKRCQPRCPHHHHCPCSSSSSSSSSSCSCSCSDHRHPPDCNSQCNNRSNSSSCTQVCGLGILGNIRVLQKEIAPENAAHECSKFGWSLLDMLSVQENDLIGLFYSCFPSPTAGAWLRSFNGVDGECLFAQLDQEYGRVNVQYPVGGDFCSGGYYVLCQTGCPSPAGPGADIGSVSIEMLYTTSTSVTYTPTTTVTRTTTVYNRQRD